MFYTYWWTKNGFVVVFLTYLSMFIGLMHAVYETINNMLSSLHYIPSAYYKNVCYLYSFFHLSFVCIQASHDQITCWIFQSFSGFFSKYISLFEAWDFKLIRNLNSLSQYSWLIDILWGIKIVTMDTDFSMSLVIISRYIFGSLHRNHIFEL